MQYVLLNVKVENSGREEIHLIYLYLILSIHVYMVKKWLEASEEGEMVKHGNIIPRKEFSHAERFQANLNYNYIVGLSTS